MGRLKKIMLLSRNSNVLGCFYQRLSHQGSMSLSPLYFSLNVCTGGGQIQLCPSDSIVFFIFWGEKSELWRDLSKLLNLPISRLEDDTAEARCQVLLLWKYARRTPQGSMKGMKRQNLTGFCWRLV